MAQTYIELEGNTTLTDSRTILNNNMNSLKTNFSGTSAPFAASADTLGATYYNTTDKKTYQVILSSGSYVWGDPPGFAHTTGNESIGGSKTFLDPVTFNDTVTAPTKAATTNTTDVATTAFVKLLVPVNTGSGVKPVYTNSNGVLTASTSTVGSTSQPVYLNNGEITAITGALANNITGNAATATSASTAAACTGNSATATASVTREQGDNSTNIATTAYVDTGLSTKQATLVSGTNLKTINNESLLGSGNISLELLPSKVGNNGKFLYTDGSTTSWKLVTEGMDTAVYNHLNRAYAWTNTQISGSGSAYYAKYVSSSSTTISDAVSAQTIIGDSVSYSYRIILDGQLYLTNTNPITPFTGLTHTTCVSNLYFIDSGNLYSGSPTNFSVQDGTGGWQTLGAYDSTKLLGIKNGSLYQILPSIVELDSTGEWTSIVGCNKSPYFAVGIKDGMLYSINSNNVITNLSSDTTWTMVSAYGNASGYALGINNGALYAIYENNIILLDATETWIKVCGGSGNNGGFAITQSGKLFTVTSSNTLTRIGTDTTWTDICGYGSNSGGINNGVLYRNLQSPLAVTNSPNTLTKCAGYYYNNATYYTLWGWTGSVTELKHTVYTVPNPKEGFSAYEDINGTVLSTITEVNDSAMTITDAYYTYNRDTDADSIFTTVVNDSTKQLVTVADLLNLFGGT